MKKSLKKAVGISLCAAIALQLAACGGSKKAEAVDLNAASLDKIIEEAKKEGKLESVGMPGSWANWQGTWDGIEAEYGIEHNDTDMSSGEEIAMFEAEKNAPTKDIGDVLQKIQEVVEQEEENEDATRRMDRVDLQFGKNYRIE